MSDNIDRCGPYACAAASFIGCGGISTLIFYSDCAKTDEAAQSSDLEDLESPSAKS